MKKSLLITLFLLIVSHTYSQKLCKSVDEFNGQITYNYESILIENDNNSNIVTLSPYFKEVGGEDRIFGIDYWSEGIRMY